MRAATKKRRTAALAAELPGHLRCFDAAKFAIGRTNGPALRKLRTHEGNELTLEVAARHAGVTAEEIQRWEAGAVPESLPRFVRYVASYYAGGTPHEVFGALSAYLTLDGMGDLSAWRAEVLETAAARS